MSSKAGLFLSVLIAGYALLNAVKVWDSFEEDQASEDVL